jgi:hypothetical protein
VSMQSLLSRFGRCIVRRACAREAIRNAWPAPLNCGPFQAYPNLVFGSPKSSGVPGDLAMSKLWINAAEVFVRLATALPLRGRDFDRGPIPPLRHPTS